MEHASDDNDRGNESTWWKNWPSVNFPNANSMWMAT